MSKSNSYSSTYCPGPINRRSFLQTGAIGLGGIGLADVLRLRAEASATNSPAPDTSVILVFLAGGLPHMETFDMKPEAPSEYRGEFRPMPTNVPGIDVCELLPLHAKTADRFSLIRSITHDFSGHDGGQKRVMTGRIPRTPAGFINDAPAGAAVVAKMREKFVTGVPSNILMRDVNRVGVHVYSLGSAYLGPSYHPFDISGDPSTPTFQVDNLSLSNEVATRLDDRRALLDGLDNLRRSVDQSGVMQAMDKYGQQAYQLLTNERARAAFDLSQEATKTRERYGHHAWGQRALLARRLVEAGSSFVTVIMENPEPGNINRSSSLGYNWDCHATSCHIFNDTRWRLPYLDQAVTGLIEDVYQRGLDKKVLVVVMSEFGHTPRINYGINPTTGALQPGRDHWPQAQAVLVSGGGLRMGQVVGSTNAKGEVPKDRPLTPNDLWATIYRHLGIDYTHAFLDHSGRPMPILPFGEPIRELI
jgi:hypothetical protein